MAPKIRYKAAQNNTKLTDFEGLKDYVVQNSVKKIPQVIKIKSSSENSLLSSY